jgi:hypothetical protein
MSDKQIKIIKSAGVTRTEQFLSELCQRTFLKVWSYPNPFRKQGKELCDLIAVFENHVFLFFDRESQTLRGNSKDISLAWDRWKKEAIDKQINQAKKARTHIFRSRNQIFLDAQCANPLPVKIPEGDISVHTIVVAHGASEACMAFSEDNVSGSLAISYSDAPDDGLSIPFMVNLDRNNIVHVFDSNTVEIILSELDTFYDFLGFIVAKETAIYNFDMLSYCGEEDLLADFYQNFDDDKKEHFIGTRRRDVNGVMIPEGEWQAFIKSGAYKRKKEADKTSYLWDELIQRTGQNALDGTLLGDDGLFESKSAIYEMAKEPRFSRRALSDAIIQAIRNFPEMEGKDVRNLSFMPSFYDGTGYVFLQVHYAQIESIDYNKTYRPARSKMLEIACGTARNKFPHLKKVVGIALEAPKFASTVSEDFILMHCENWTDDLRRHYEEQNKELRFFKSASLQMKYRKISNFPAPPKTPKRGKVGRNDPCPCGSSKKYKRCHGA